MSNTRPLQPLVELPESPNSSRRRFLGLCVASAATLAIRPGHAAVTGETERSLSFHHLHTGERLREVYWADGEYIDEGVAAIRRLFRDFRTGDSHRVDLKLLDTLHHLRQKTHSSKPFEIISAYRSPKTNAMLRNNSSGVAKKSLHMQGKAIDIRVPGQDLKKLQLAARSLKSGGVGYYPKSGFIHLDTGRVRYW